jgi:hypothetical protein
MNVFFLDKNPNTNAKYHVDKHCVKMILEYAQLLSTAHRYLDGKQIIETSVIGRKHKRWVLDNELDNVLYKATHINHPSSVWARSSLSNYMWLSHMLVELCKEYTYRYGKIHKCEQTGLVDTLLNNVPTNIPNKPFTEPTPAMPDIYKVAGNSIQSYHNYYNGDKRRMFKWRNREVPYFITE